MSDICLIYTTFLRPELMKETLLSVVKNIPYDMPILVGDQSYNKNDYSELEGKYPNIYIYPLSYDCGLSYARNFLIAEAIQKFNCQYIWLTADSIKFTPDTYNEATLKEIVDYLQVSPEYGIIGLGLKNRESWEYNLDLQVPKGFVISKPKDPIINYKNLQLQKCDICKNFFIGKSDLILSVGYDNLLKTCEHEDFFWRFKQAGYKTFFTNILSGEYVKAMPGNYAKMRNRLYKDFCYKLMGKYKINKWIIREK